MSDMTRDVAEGAARLLSRMRWLGNKAIKEENTNLQIAALLNNLEQVCKQLQDVILHGDAELQEGRDELASGMAELKDGQEKLKEGQDKLQADNMALTSQLQTLETCSRALEAEKEKVRTIAATQAEEKARLDEKSKLLQEKMTPIEQGVRDLKITMEEGHRGLVNEVQSSLAEVLRHEEEDRRHDEQRKEEDRRHDEERKADNATIAGGFSQLQESVARVAEKQGSLKDDSTAILRRLTHVRDTATDMAKGQADLVESQMILRRELSTMTDEWVIARAELQNKLQTANQGHSDALLNLANANSENKRLEEQINRLTSEVQEIDELRTKVSEMGPKMDELDQIRRMLGRSEEEDAGPSEEVSVVQLVEVLRAKCHKNEEGLEGLKKTAEELEEQLLVLKRNDIMDGMKAVDSLDKNTANMKRKARDIQPGAVQSSSKRQRNEIDWRTRTETLTLFLRSHMPVPDPDGSVSELLAINLLVAAMLDVSMAARIHHWLEEEAAQGQWYCFDELALRAFSADAEIDEDDRCFRHHSSGKQEDCYQIRICLNEDSSAPNSIVCRLRRGLE